MAVDRSQLGQFTTSKVGGKYVWGGTTDAGYDCSGLIYTAYQQQGVNIPRVAQDQYNAANKVSRDQLQYGDSVFFSDTGSTSNVTHTGMYIGNGKYVHASSPSKGIIISDLPTSGSYFVGGGSFNGVSYSGGNGGTYKPNSGSGMSSNLQAALNSLGQAGTAAQLGTNVGDMQNYQTTGTYVANGVTNAVGYVVDQVSVKEKILKIIGQVVKFITLLLFGILAAVLFMKAFDIKAPILNTNGG